MEDNEKISTTPLVGYKAVSQKFFLIKPRKMFSLGSFEIKDMTAMQPGLWWYSFTFLFIEISWGRMVIWKKEEKQ